jgi:hypothetical protein
MDHKRKGAERPDDREQGVEWEVSIDDLRSWAKGSSHAHKSEQPPRKRLRVRGGESHARRGIRRRAEHSKRRIGLFQERHVQVTQVSVETAGAVREPPFAQCKDS